MSAEILDAIQMSIGQHDSRPKPSVRILLVDDNSHGLCARKTILEQLGYAVVAKSCPHQAVECFDSEHFDLVITDFRMPGMDGSQLISRIRTARPQVPVVLISGFADMLGLTEATTGANAVIQKSAHEVHMMVRTVERLLEGEKNPRKPVASYRPAASARAVAGAL
jgi:CheY-like chemotaxis protein